MTLTIHQALEASGPATAIVLTDAQVEVLGGGKRAAVRVTIAGRSTRVRLGVMGGRNLIGLSKASRPRSARSSRAPSARRRSPRRASAVWSQRWRPRGSTRADVRPRPSADW